MNLGPPNPPSGRLKKVFDEVNEAMFQSVENNANSFSPSWSSKKATWTCLVK
jgi:hypothetical protein